MDSAIDPHIRKIKADAGENYDLLPSNNGSWWMPREWTTGSKQDVIAVDIRGLYNPLDLLVHEIGHKKWTPRSAQFKELLNIYGGVLNICEDARIEHLAVARWGYLFKSWRYPEMPMVHLTPEDAILWGLYVKKVAHSRREDVPQEWKDLLLDFWGEIERAYRELISIRDEEEYSEFLRRWFPHPPRSHPYNGSLDVDLTPSQKEFEERCTASRQLAEKLGAGTEARYGDWFDYSIPPPPLPPALMSLLSRLVVEETERIPVPCGGRYSFRRDLRDRKDFYLRTRRKYRKEVSIIVDTSASMRKVAKEVRVLLAGLNSLAKRGVLEGKAIFVAGGRTLLLPLPTLQPIWAVKFEGGTNGYKMVLPHVRDADVVLFVSDMAIDVDDVKTVKELQSKAYFLYGGDAYYQLLSDAKRLGFRNLCFAPTIVGALQKVIALLGL